MVLDKLLNEQNLNEEIVLDLNLQTSSPYLLNVPRINDLLDYYKSLGLIPYYRNKQENTEPRLSRLENLIVGITGIFLYDGNSQNIIEKKFEEVVFKLPNLYLEQMSNGRYNLVLLIPQEIILEKNYDWKEIQKKSIDVLNDRGYKI
ncbi:MAG: hypothetical protein QXE31_05430 [Candidatus Woesearchaeota archaeon]